MVERVLQLPNGRELDRLGLGQQRVGTIKLGGLDRRGRVVAELGNARLGRLEQPHPLEQALVARGDLCQDVRQALGRDILASEDLEHSGQRLMSQVERGAELADAGVGLQDSATRRFPDQVLQI